ncbi:MAG: UbiD family decarboxylase [Chloroflexi bacterium]|nr:UbiD family decarboxylase [Chloroflexota bacterium]
MAYRDLREYIDQVDKIGELKRLDGVSWDLEAGAIASMTPDAVLFDNFPGYPAGHRMLINIDRPSIRRWFLAVNMSTQAKGNALATEWKDRLLNLKPTPPKWVSHGPILENVHEGNDVNVLEFPAPKIHPDDGGRYLGTADVMITRDPTTGKENFGTFRMQVHEPATLGVYICHGKDTALILEEYHKQGKSCPVVAIVGIDPAMFIAGRCHLPHCAGVTEYDLAGYFKQESIEVVKGEFTGLPIPARAEIAIEGEIVPGDVMTEGPFGEWTGYSEPRESHVIRVKRVLHRNDPILTVVSPSPRTRPPGDKGLVANPFEAGFIWEQLERAGIRRIKGVAYYSRFLLVISIKNSYAGHARQAGHVATQCHAGAFMGKYTIVVDEDIDPYKIQDVLWAVMRRADPQRAIDIVRYCWSDRMDSAISYEEKTSPVPILPVYNSRCVIDACKPVEWDPKLKRNVEYDPEMHKRVREKWGEVLFGKK